MPHLCRGVKGPAAPYRLPKSVDAEGDYRHLRLSEQQADGVDRLVGCDLLLVFYTSDIRSTWNCRRVINRRIQQTEIPKKKKKKKN